MAKKDSMSLGHFLQKCLRRAKQKSLPHEDVYTRIQRSEIHGVGVFAIRRIPKGTNIFQHDNSEMVDININEISDIDAGLKKLYDDFSIISKDGRNYKCPKNFNNLTVAWYLNDSDESRPANVRCDKQYNFWAIRDIEKGEELLVNSSTYSEQPYRNKLR